MFLQLRPVTHSANKANNRRSQSHSQEKIELEEEAVREILVPDTAWELGVETSDFED